MKKFSNSKIKDEQYLFYVANYFYYGKVPINFETVSLSGTFHFQFLYLELLSCCWHYINKIYSMDLPACFLGHFTLHNPLLKLPERIKR